MKKIQASVLLVLISTTSFCQLRWVNVDSLFGALPSSVHVFRTADSIDGKPNIAYYLIADLNDKSLDFTADTSHGRRLKPSQYFERNDSALLVVNTTFFSFATNQNLNVVIRDGEKVASNIIRVRGRGADSNNFIYPHSSAIGIRRKRKADIAWVKADSVSSKVWVSQEPPVYSKPKTPGNTNRTTNSNSNTFRRWKMETAVGGGPVLVQDGNTKITNEEEFRFAGKAINDRHPRTAMGYTKDNKLIILVVEGRNAGRAEGATLGHLAQIFVELGCVEALNLDGGGSSCMLVNGKETIRVSDASGQRPVPAVFIIKRKKQLKIKN
jgi:hypothetical protein